MRFDILTIFPSMFDSYVNESIIRRAREKKLVDIRVHDLRKFTNDKHNSVDDRPYGGGPGMVMRADVIMRAFDSLKIRKDKKTKIIIFSAGGKQFEQETAQAWAKKYTRIVMIAGRYEGIDERIFKILQTPSSKLQAVSIGPYVLTGGELPAMVILDAVSRHVPGVLGKEESLEENRFGVGLPAYTRPEMVVWKGKKYIVPHILLGGNHKLIEMWREKAVKKSAH